ncbi:MAG: DUF1624 domain-containing protein [Alphaproteobacteria bacterium]|nr:DUF1624 domain-containing protein [Alphaproteobacteria bacterium]
MVEQVQAATAATRPKEKAGGRALALDALKGVIMVVMALDHTRSFLMKYDGVKEIWYAPATYNPQIWDFVSRYVSHLAAPGFFFLMGMGMVLMAESRRKIGWDDNKVFHSFLKRGAILILLQFTLENLAWFERSHNVVHFLSTGVLSTLGACMIFGSFMMRYRAKGVAAVSVMALLATAMIIQDLDPASHDDQALLSAVLFVAGRAGAVKVNYPIIPWLGVTGLGMLYGWYWAADRVRGYRTALYLGLVLVAAFVAMRNFPGFWNYRMPVDGSVQAFLQATKYPPSLSWLSLMLGANFLIVWLFWKGEALVERYGQVLLAYGRSALFFYIVHLHVFGIMSLIFFNGHTTIVSMAGVLWLIALAILWPLCTWYGRFKAGKDADSIWRLL